MTKANEPFAIPTITDLAWAAGIIDGEGCVFIAVNHTPKGTPCHELRLVLVNTNHPMLLRFRAWFGGAIGRKKKRGTQRRNLAEWRIVGRRAASCLELLLPYLLVKKDEAALGIEMARTLMSKKDYNANSGLGAPRPPEEIIERREAIRLELQRMKRIEYTFSDFERETTVNKSSSLGGY